MPKSPELLDVISDTNLIVKWYAIVIIMVSVAAGVFLFDQAFGKEIISNAIVRLGLYSVFELVIFLVWQSYRTSLPQRTVADPSTSLGIAISVETASNEARTLLVDRFLPEFQRQIKDAGLADLLDIIDTENHQAQRIGSVIETLEADANIPRKESVIQSKKEEWTLIHNTVKADFYLWGKLYKLENQYVLDFKGYVDQNLEPELKEEVKKEYAQFGVKERIYGADEALTGVAVEARFFYIVAKYVIALVAFYSGKFEDSLRLHQSLENDLTKEENFQSKDLLLHALKKRLSALHFLQARIMMSKADNWEAIQAAEAELEVAKGHDPTNPNVYMFAAANDYLLRRNWSSAWANIQKVKEYAQKNDTAWRYSIAFLQLAKESYPDGLATYEDIFANPFQHEDLIAKQVIEFNTHILRQDPNFMASKFIIAIVRGQILKDYRVAIEEIEQFIAEVGKSAKYQLLRKASQEYKKKFIAALELDSSVDRILHLTDET